jgi:isopentenyldiphosphate isomerase
MTNIEIENKRLLDVVNDNDEVVGSETRADVHKLGLLHREIHVWMFDKDKNIFFQKRGLHSTSAGLLDATVGGHVNQGEDYLDAAVRETQEETGLSVNPSDLVFLKKLQDLHDSNEYTWGTSNNFIRSVYIYKHPIDSHTITKEVGIPGGGFQKLSYELLSNPDKKSKEMIHKFIIEEEIQHILKYLK